MNGFKAWWNRQSKGVKTAVVVVAVLLTLAIIGSFGSTSGTSTEALPSGQVTSAANDEPVQSQTEDPVELAFAACKVADDAVRGTGDDAHAEIRPELPTDEWPDARSLYFKTWDTGVVDFRGEIAGVEFGCVYVPKSDRAQVGWGEGAAE